MSGTKRTRTPTKKYASIWQHSLARSLNDIYLLSTQPPGGMNVSWGSFVLTYLVVLPQRAWMRQWALAGRIHFEYVGAIQKVLRG